MDHMNRGLIMFLSILAGALLELQLPWLSQITSCPFCYAAMSTSSQDPNAGTV